MPTPVATSSVEADESSDQDTVTKTALATTSAVPVVSSSAKEDKPETQTHDMEEAADSEQTATPEPSTNDLAGITTAEFTRLQAELLQLKSAKYESETKCSKLQAKVGMQLRGSVACLLISVQLKELQKQRP